VDKKIAPGTINWQAGGIAILESLHYFLCVSPYRKTKIAAIMKPTPAVYARASLACLAILAFMVAFRAPSTEHPIEGKWEKLGEHTLTLDLHSGEFNFPDNSPVLSAIKIRSKKGAINLQRCMINFANGEKISIELRNDIAPGAESRAINLPGNTKPMTKFVFWYGVSQSGAEKAEIEIWGRN
jgi:hypothetical protein